MTDTPDDPRTKAPPVRRVEIFTGAGRRGLAIRRLDDDLVVTGLAEQQKSPVAQDGYSGQWRTGKPLHVVFKQRALRLNPFAQRSISGTPIGVAPN